MSERYVVKHCYDDKAGCVLVYTYDNDRGCPSPYHIEVKAPNWFDAILGRSFEEKFFDAIKNRQCIADQLNRDHDKNTVVSETTKQLYERMFGSGDNGKV